MRDREVVNLEVNDSAIAILVRNDAKLQLPTRASTQPLQNKFYLAYKGHASKTVLSYA